MNMKFSNKHDVDSDLILFNEKQKNTVDNIAKKYSWDFLNNKFVNEIEQDLNCDFTMTQAKTKMSQVLRRE